MVEPEVARTHDRTCVSKALPFSGNTLQAGVFAGGLLLPVSRVSLFEIVKHLLRSALGVGVSLDEVQTLV